MSAGIKSSIHAVCEPATAMFFTKLSTEMKNNSIGHNQN